MISQGLGYVGNYFPDLYHIFKKLMEPCGMLFYHILSVVTYQGNLKLAEKGHNIRNEHKNLVTAIMAFSVVKDGKIVEKSSLQYFTAVPKKN